MKKLYDLCVVTSSYSQNGQQKNRFENIGSLCEKDGRKFIMLKAHFNPAAISRQEGSDCIFVSMFAPKDKNSGQGNNNNRNDNSQQWDGNPQTAGYDDYDDSKIPF